MSEYRKQLLEKFINRRITPEELEDFLNRMQTDEEFKNDEVLKELWTELKGTGPIDSEKALRIGNRLNAGIREEKIQIQSPVKRLPRRITGLVAAVAFLLLAAGGLIYYLNTPVTVNSGYGEIVEVVLPDDSRVRLNANSRLRYSRRWNSAESRIVSLEGEAFFEVKKDEVTQKKFIVNAGDLKVEVLGTEFNVNTRHPGTYPGGNRTTKVFLESGSVRLTSREGDDSLMMIPGEEAGIDESGHLAKTAKAEEDAPVAEWKDGSKMMKDRKLSDILEEYRNIFGVEFKIIDSVILDQAFTVVFPITDQSKATNILKNLLGDQIADE